MRDLHKKRASASKNDLFLFVDMQQCNI